jgi:regulator of sigma E protease
MHDFVISVVAFIVLVGVMVLVHEFGHFIVAKLCGVRVERFSIGFPPRLFGVKIGETDYCVSATLVGGYVKMTGETPEQNLEFSKEQPQDLSKDPGALTSHPRWQRMLIGLAGPAANFALAFGLMAIYYGFFNEVPSVEVKTTTVEWVTPATPAAQAGFQPGDVLRRFDNVENPSWEQVYARTKLNPDQNVAVTVDRDGRPVNLVLRVPNSARSDDFEISDTGILPQYLPGPIGVAEVQQETPAAQAGLRAGDAIAAVDGHAFHTVPALLAYMQTEQGKPMALTVLRNGTTLQLTAHPAKLDAGWKLGFSTVAIPLRTQPLPIGAAMKKSASFCTSNSFLIVEVLERLFTRKVSVSQLSGPVGIARMAGDAAQTKGWWSKFGLAGEISLNLGILNLLPFPILDGGMILLLLIESALRRDISLAIKERVLTAAFVVLLAFFAFTVFNDVTKLPVFTHLKP